MSFRSTSITGLVAVMLFACAHAPSTQSSQWHADCGAAIEGIEPLVQPGRTLVLGEVHGTREVADFVAAAVCQAAHAGPVVLGLEVPNEPQFDAYLSSDGGPTAQAALLATGFWTAAFQDGRESVAMLGLVERIRALKQRGLPVELLLFDAQPEDGSQRDRLMAEKIITRHAQRPQAAFVLLMGNLHALKKTGSPWKPDDGYAWLTSLLTWPVVSLNAGHADGTAWMCMTPKAEECGPGVIAERDTTGRRSVTLAASKDGAYDGVFDVVTFTASPPAAFPAAAKGFDEKLVALLKGPQLKIASARRAAMKGDFASCAQTLGALPDLGPDELYNLACCQSRSKQLDAAFDSLKRSFAAGFNDFEALQGDADLAALHTDPRWQQLLKK